MATDAIMSPIDRRRTCDDVAGADRGLAVAGPCRPAAGRSGRRRSRVPVSASPAGQVDADVAADGRAGRGVRRRAAASRGRSPPACQASYASHSDASSATSSVGPVGLGADSSASEVAVGTGSSSAVMRDVEPDPDDRGRARSASRPARPGSRRPSRSPTQDVVGPLHRRRRSPRAAQRLVDGEPVSSGSHGQSARGDRRAQQHREGQRRPGRRLPGAVEPAAAGGLVLGDDDQPLGGAGPGAVGDQRVGRGGLLDAPRPPARCEQVGMRPRPARVGVERSGVQAGGPRSRRH